MCLWMNLDYLLQQDVMAAMNYHKGKCSEWKDGSVRKYWVEHSATGQSILCVEYDSGNVWKYRRNAKDEGFVFN
ncbi:hypothetical protein [Butyrivibrio sp. NC3005]|uniref:hypothetical protein n=1 Tax=Butyrivibrio sp. NC3005 TaxID=1280685 RepID=UPI0004057096|nr:hypothetical protein [Butyrivibrio sp. NC3005]